MLTCMNLKGRLGKSMGGFMWRSLVKYAYSAFFSSGSYLKMAAASTIGLLVGILPAWDLKLVILIAMSLLFRLNIIALALGLGVSIVLPLLYMLPIWNNSTKLVLVTDSSSLAAFFSYLERIEVLPGMSLMSILRCVSLAIISLLLFMCFYSFGIKTALVSARKDFVFLDYSSKRWSCFKRFALAALIISVIIAVMFTISIFKASVLPGLKLEDKEQTASNNQGAPMLSEELLASQLEAIEKEYKLPKTDQKGNEGSRNRLEEEEYLVFGFYQEGNKKSTLSLKRNIQSIDILIPGWFVLDSNMTLTHKINEETDRLASDNKVKEMPSVRNYTDDGQIVAGMKAVLSSPTLRSRLIGEILEQVRKRRYAGVTIDFRIAKAGEEVLLEEFIGELYKEFRTHGLKVAQAVPAGDNRYNHARLCLIVDYLIIGFYDEHHLPENPGPIASFSWMESNLNRLEDPHIPPEKLVIGLGNYGYEWIQSSNKSIQRLSFDEVMDIAEVSGSEVTWDKRNGNPYFGFERGRERHSVWFLDGATLYNQLKLVSNKGIKNFALWRLGYEDPTIWYLLKLESGEITHIQNYIDSLYTLKNTEYITYSGKGEILILDSIGRCGKRSINIDQAGFIKEESYEMYPRPFMLNRYGASDKKVMALTFDDGPDPLYTPKVLDILKQNNVKATFFVVGKNVLKYPDIVGRIFDEGHEIGNHTFSHLNIEKASGEAIDIELNTTQRFIQAVTGHSTLLFRPPHTSSIENLKTSFLLPILKAQNKGYIMVGHSIDPWDWNASDSSDIMERIKPLMGTGNIILLHDAGGDRISMLKALPDIIKYTQNQGYPFVTVSQLLGKDKKEVMPPVAGKEEPYTLYNRIVVTVFNCWNSIIGGLFCFAIAIGVFRFVFLLVFSYRQRLKHVKRTKNEDYKPFVSVIIPVYNEERVICKTVGSILRSRYPSFEVIVVNDGSTDGTVDVLRDMFGTNPRVKLISKENGGKASALNDGIREAYGKIVVILDGDTVIHPDTIARLVEHFADDRRVVAVSGNVKVGNICNLLTLWQHVEYVTGFNLERRAFSELNCITVVPGAIGAWRKRAIENVGFFKDDTLAEDTDITLELLRKGYRITYEESAYAYTEVPENLAGLLKQRYRWLFGTLQCLWKHKDALFNKRYKALGFVALPNMWLFQYIFQALSPIIDIYFIMGLMGKDALTFSVFYMLFLAADYFTAFYAFRLEKEKLSPLMFLFIQRVVYRLIIVYVIIKSVFSALKGELVAWNKLKRKGTVKEGQQISR